MRADDLILAPNGWKFDRLGRLRRMGRAERECQRRGILVIAASGTTLTPRDYALALQAPRWAYEVTVAHRP